MLYESGTATSLLEIANKFIEFLQKSNSEVQAWELVQNKLQTYFGATLKVPIGDNDGFYVSLSHHTITKNTYSSFVSEKYLTQGIGDIPTEGIFSPAKNGIGGYRGLDLFKDTGEIIQVGLHTLFDDALTMYEQPQITCEDETINPECANLCSTVAVGYRTVDIYESPRYVGTGLPWLTLSDSDVDSEFVKDAGLKYFFTKTNYDATITFRTNYKIKYWQSISFGKFNSLTSQDEYMHPLFIAGGTQALEQAQLDYQIPNSPALGHIVGNAYKLSMKNTCLSNSNLLNATKFNGALFSNFKVLLPNGKWVSLYSHEQSATSEGFFSCHTPNYNAYYKLRAPELYVGNKHNSIFPYNGLTGMVGTMHDKNEDNQPEYRSTSKEKIYIVASSTEQKFILGYLPNCFISWDDSLTEGIYEYNNKKYLAIPNVWVNRKTFYEPILTTINNVSTAENDLILNKEINTSKFRTRLIIPLE